MGKHFKLDLRSYQEHGTEFKPKDVRSKIAKLLVVLRWVSTSGGVYMLDSYGQIPARPKGDPFRS